MRLLYNLLTYLLLLPYVAYWLGRGVVNRVYWDKLGQRFGFGFPKLERCVWIHAVSVGEVQAAVPLIRALAKRFPDHPLLVTTVTPTGAERVRAVFDDLVVHCYIPFELTAAIDNFFDSVHPKLALIMETEIWPNLYRGCGTRKIPLILVSARISPRSVKSYRRLLPLFRETLSHGIIIAAQSETDAERFLSLGADPKRTWVTGNIKFDIELPRDLVEKGVQFRETVFGRRPVWIAASTHEKEETAVLDAHRELLQRHANLLLVIVPRHPERFPAVRELIAKSGFDCVARSERKPCKPETTVFLGDTMGELPLFYAATDIAFVGGSLVPVGGHNMLEPASLGMPVLSGPNVFNAQEIADEFAASNACRMVSNETELAAAVDQLLANRDAAKTIGENARNIVHRNRGALQRLLDLLEPLLSEADR